MKIYSKEIKGKNITITVKKVNNSERPYLATSSYKQVLGYGKTEDEAKKICENAVAMDIIMN